MQNPNPLLEVLVNAAEASAQGQLTASAKNIYTKLEDRIQERFSQYPQTRQTFARFERDPYAQQREMADALYRTGAINDPDIINRAKQLYQMRFDGELTRQSQTGQSGLNMRNSRIVHNNPWPIVIVTVAILLLLAFVTDIFFPGFFAAITRGSPQPSGGASPTSTAVIPDGTPIDTLTSFCSLVRANGSDYAWQYLYSDHLKSHVSIADFNQIWSFYSNPLVSCIPTINNSSGSTASGTITTMSFKTNQTQVYAVTLVEKDSQWQIDSMNSQ